jgi:hypothetical protein
MRDFGDRVHVWFQEGLDASPILRPRHAAIRPCSTGRWPALIDHIELVTLDPNYPNRLTGRLRARVEWCRHRGHLMQALEGPGRRETPREYPTFVVRERRSYQIEEDFAPVPKINLQS